MKKLVAGLADKIQPIESCFTAHYRFVLVESLFGNETQMDGRPIRLGGKTIVDSAGRRAIYFEEGPEQTALRRWRAGQFSEAEHLLAEQWRDSTRKFDLESWTRSKRKLPNVRTISELRERAWDICDSAKYQLENLRFLLFEAGIPQPEATEVYNHWLSQGCRD